MQRQFIRLSIMGIFLISLVFGAVVFADTGMATTMNSARGPATGNLVGDVATGNTVSSSPATSPAIAFTASARVGKAPLTIRFTDRSTQSPTSWLWNFGDGTTSKLQNPVHTYSSVGTYTVTLSATNAIGTNSSTKTSYITLLTPAPISNYNNGNLYVANSQGVKYDIPNGIAKVFTYTYVPDTYFVLFEQANGGLNALHISSTTNAFSGSDITRTTNKSGSFWITFSGGQPSMPDGVLMLAVNGTIPDGFTVNIRSSGQEFDPGTPGLSNQPMPTHVTFLDGAVNETFTKSDFIYGPQNWKPCSSSGYPIYTGENQNDPINQYQIMFIDLRVGAVQNKSLPNNGMIKVEYSFTNLTSTAVFNIYGWYEQCNHGTGIIMTNDVTSSGYMVSGTAGVPDARFTANVTSGPFPLAVQFTDTSTNFPTSWLWNFGDGGTSTVENPVHTYSSAGTYTVQLTATNGQGSNSLTRSNYITITASGTPVVSFMAAPVNGGVPLVVRFTDTSTNSPTSWSWDFGDGSTSTSQNPSHTYTSAGTYTVTLTTGSLTGNNRLTKNGFIYATTATGALPGYTDIYVRAANHDGIRQDVNGNGTYYISPGAASGGLSAIHISTDPSVSAGQVTASQNPSGTFYVTANSGAYQDESVLLLAVNGTIPDDFSARITTSGYTWTPTGSVPASGSSTYQSSALNQTFTKDDFFYGPQNWKPTQGDANYPLFYGQDMNSSKNQYRLMFIDTRAGILSDSSLTDNGAVRVQYSFTDLPGTATFNVYGWKSGQGMQWTNALTGSAASGYTVSPTTPTVPPVANFTANTTSGRAPLTVAFTDASTNSPTSWTWTFGDGNTSAVQNPAHTYTTAGTYTVNLTASNSAGNNTVTHAGYITVRSGSGTSSSEIGVFRPSTGYWYLDYTNDGTVDKAVRFGKGGDTPVVGDWNNTGTSGIGVFRKSTGYWYLDSTNDEKADITVKFGKGGDTPVVGDWNGAGKSEIGVFRESTGYWYLDYNFDGIADKTVKFGKGGDTLVVGDWNNTGTTGIGVFRKSTGYWYLDFNNDGTADKTVKLGKAGDTPVVGDWNGAGKSEIGVFRESTGYWYLDYNFDGIVDKTVKLGKGGDTQVVGDWNGAGTTGIGVFRKSTNYWYLDNNLDGTIDYQFRFGTNNDIPEVGHWA
ncbi:PKD domain-containing protein [Methanoregula sp.]|uniref:PKD domain-containing protein n=1 Tax=Methanoregula sp. TaxID=2052170 RepID=UPI00356B5655